jgi:two-component system response regulator MprA
MNQNILVVEDDKDLREVLRDLLVDQGYVVWMADDGTQAISLVQKNEPNLILLDLGLPTLTGESVVHEVKKSYPEIPIIILTGRSGVSDVVMGLNLGADDYITKPFATEELLARIKARLRTSQPEEKKLVVSDLELDTKTLEVKRGDKLISLTPQEFKILEYLMSNKGRVLTREMILSRLWRSNPDIETRVVDVYIGYLRKKIDAGHKKKIIQSVRGFGYKVVD